MFIISITIPIQQIVPWSVSEREKWENMLPGEPVDFPGVGTNTQLNSH